MLEFQSHEDQRLPVRRVAKAHRRTVLGVPRVPRIFREKTKNGTRRRTVMTRLSFSFHQVRACFQQERETTRTSRSDELHNEEYWKDR
jgi:hypothetical protein